MVPVLALPTLTTLLGLPPANVEVTPPTVPVGVGVGASLTEPLPSATSPALLAIAFGPIATESVPSAWLSAAVEFAWKYLMPWLLMLSIAEPTLLAVDVVPFALYVVYDGAETVPVAGL
ncbi:Tash protein PEST motif family [Burkholderia territorii]|nr:Tash protein PEST motif family [Burkholderia territorii]KVQ54151.1 Tash protein PEST motif family [Burkholderia territorii]KWA11039.1 Tash protein PEST motif family [Burkholderia territorii]KWA24805.1 Tash protein PEST motif family [Burkholderia territorii]KWA41202.1 Tash protein PEST motif family [Burkholderia territorii]